MAFNLSSLLASNPHASLYVDPPGGFPSAAGSWYYIGPFGVQGFELEGPVGNGFLGFSKGYSIALMMDAGTNPPVAWFLGQNRILFKLPVATGGEWYLLTFTNRTVLQHTFQPAVPVDENHGNMKYVSHPVGNQTRFLWTIGVDDATAAYTYV